MQPFSPSRARAVLACCVLLAGLIAAAPSSAARSELSSIQVLPEATTTQVVLELSAPAQSKFFILDSPRRAVIDLRAVGVAAGRKAPAGQGLATSVRMGPQANGDLRVVVETPSGTPVRLQRPAGAALGVTRLVIELGASASASSSTVATEDPGPAVATRPPNVAVKAAHAPAENGREIVVAIDAGHGGPDPGAVGRAGTYEKNVVLDIARELAARVNREPGMRAVLTRDGDYFLTLRQRINRARAAKADMFVSVHADAVRDPGVSGGSVYVLSEKGATDEQSRWLAERENAADLKGGVSLDDKDRMLASVLLDLSQSASISASMEAAERVLRAIGRVSEVRKPAVQQAGFVVLKSPDIPSMLVETAFISSPADELMLRSDDRRKALAEAIFMGVHSYFGSHPPEGTRFANTGKTPASPTPYAAR